MHTELNPTGSEC